jgi:RES domain
VAAKWLTQMNGNNDTVEPPPHLRGTLLSSLHIVQCFSTGPSAILMIDRLYRASNPAKFVVPPAIIHHHRFGPPEKLRESFDGWLYAAAKPHTAACEALFFANDEQRPGTYFVNRGARRNGVIAQLDFDDPLLLWDLRGTAINRLGIYDQMLSPDQEWSQWFGYRVHQAIMSLPPAERPVGFAYPSRRHPAETAVAIHSHCLELIRQKARVTVTRFSEYLALPDFANDALLVDPPATEGFD